MGKHVYINEIMGVLVSTVALCSVDERESRQMCRTALVMWNSRHTRPPPLHFGEDVAETM